MVNEDTRNNLIVIIILVAIAVMITSLVVYITDTLTRLGNHSENVINSVGHSLEANLTLAANTSAANMADFDKKMTKIVEVNNITTTQRGLQYANITAAINQFNAHIQNLTKINSHLLAEQQKTNIILMQQNTTTKNNKQTTNSTIENKNNETGRGLGHA